MVDEAARQDEMLLDLHLGQLSAREAERLRERMAASAELSARSRALGALLGHLDDVPAPKSRPGLADRVLEYIEDRTAVHSLSEAGSSEEPLPPADRPTLLEWTWAWRDVLAAAACVALFFMLVVPGYQKARNVSARYQCLNHVRQIGSGMAQYATANAGFLPSAGYVPEGSWLPETPDGQQPAPNTRHVFKLVKDGHVRNVRFFVCPADRGARPMEAEDLASLKDFPSRRNNSYSFIFMNVPQGLRLEAMQRGARRRMVLLADRNPHFPSAAGSERGARMVSTGNSPLHEAGAGQNAIYVDGSGGWFTSPRIGVDEDDIYRVGDLSRYEGTEAPRYDTDTFLPP